MAESLKNKTIKGIAWSSAERFSVQGVQFLVMLVMARLLSPEDYGVVGMVAIFNAIAQTLIDSGFSTALIRKQNRTEIDNSTVFYFNIVVGLVLYAIFFIIAPYVAAFYNLPLLTAVMRVVCLGVLINSLAVVQRAIYSAIIDFKTQAKASLIAAIVSGITGICLALLGYGVWALVWQQLVSLSVNVIILWIYSRWIPSLIFSWKSFMELFSFGSKLLAAGLIDTLYRNIYPIVIGKGFSADSLGHYTRAQHFGAMPSSNISGIIQRVTFPVLCNVQDDDVRLASVYRRILRCTVFIIFPLMVGLSAISYPLIQILIGLKWTFCAQLLTIMCFSMMWYPVHALNLNLLGVKGRSDLFLRLEIIKKALGITMLCVTFKFGLVVMCYGQICNSLLCLIINTYYTGKLIHVGLLSQLRDVLPTLLLCMAMFLLIRAEAIFLSNEWILLVLGVSTGIACYIGLAYVFRLNEMKELYYIIKRNKYD